MTAVIGLLCAIGAMLSWGFGDFFIQRTTRAVGSAKAIFFIGLSGSIALFPFVYGDLPSLSASQLYLLILLAAVTFLGAHFDFEAMRMGKISIVEPIIGLELPLTVGMSAVFSSERFSPVQLCCMVAVFIGIILSATEHVTHLHYHRRLFERGVAIAGIAAVGMALTNYLVGFSSQETSPMVTIWFSHSCIALISGINILSRGTWRTLLADLRKHRYIIGGESLFDNLAWVLFGSATTMLPIAIATTISESYIALAVLLGVFVNHERLKRHQVLGIVLAILGILILSAITGEA